MASMKAHTHFRCVLGSTAPLSDPPTAEHAGPCFGYTFRKCRHHIRCSGRPSWGRCLPWTMSFQTSSTTKRLVPKNSRNSLTSVNPAPTRRRVRFWMTRAMAQKSGSGSLPMPSATWTMVWSCWSSFIKWPAAGGEEGRRAVGRRRIIIMKRERGGRQGLVVWGCVCACLFFFRPARIHAEHAVVPVPSLYS
jgi:hypothetical protein